MSKIEPFHKQIDSRGWLVSSSKLSKVFSPNFDERPHNLQPALVIIHNISLPLGNFGGKNVENLFLNKLDTSRPEFENLKSLKVSSHFFIKRSGHIVQFVSTFKRAWHAGDSSFMGITGCNDFSIGIELEGSDFVSFEEKQYYSLFYILQVLAKKFPLLSAITSHEFIAPQRKTDPGPFFDWKNLERNLQALSIFWKIFRKKN